MPDVLSPDQKDLRKKIIEKLSRKQPPQLVPSRSEKELPLYRQKLLQWLAE